jgi:hypothetical protein
MLLSSRGRAEQVTGAILVAGDAQHFRQELEYIVERAITGEDPGPPIRQLIGRASALLSEEVYNPLYEEILELAEEAEVLRAQNEAGEQAFLFVVSSLKEHGAATVNDLPPAARDEVIQKVMDAEALDAPGIRLLRDDDGNVLDVLVWVRCREAQRHRSGNI